MEWCRWRRPSQGGTLGGRPDTHLHRRQRVEIMQGPRFGDLAWKITEDGFPVWASKLEWGPSAAGQPGGFLGLGLKTEGGTRCGRVARRVSRFGPQNLEWRPARSDDQEGLVIWPQNHQGGRFLGLGLKTKDGGLARLSGPRTCRGTWRSWFRWFGPQNHHGGGFSGFGLKTGVGARRQPGDPEDAWTVQGGCVELRQGAPSTPDRPMGFEKETD